MNSVYHGSLEVLSPLTGSLSLSVRGGLELSTYSDYGARLMDVSTASSLPENSSELASSRDDSFAGEDIQAFSSQESIDAVIGPSDASIPDWLVLNCAVTVLPDNRCGTVRYVGSTEFSSGIWVGVELDEPNGDSNGEYDGVRYFSCEKEYGIFVRANLVAPKPVDPASSKKETGKPSVDNDSSTKKDSDKQQATPKSAANPQPKKGHS